MHEFDLIPAYYRERIRIERWCLIFIVVYIGVLLVITGLNYAIGLGNKNLNSEIKALQKGKILNFQQHKKYDELLTEEKLLTDRLKILEGLRSGLPAKQVLLAIDRVMNNDIWFEKWSFKRTGVVSEVKPETVQTGYFIIIPKDSNNSNNQQAWQLKTHMEIRGQAINHSSLAAFVGRLLEQPEIQDVKILNTKARAYQEFQLVDFNLIVIIDNLYLPGNV